jgi:signal transduction histidine kinase
MPRWLLCTVAAGCAWPTIVVLRTSGELSLAGPSLAAHVLTVGAGLLLVLAAAVAHADSPVRPRLLAAAAAAWLAAEWASPAAPGALVFTVGLAATGLALPLVLAMLPDARPAALVAGGGALLLGPLAAMAVDPRDVGCSDCPADLLAVASNAELADRLWRLGAELSILACVVAVALSAFGVRRSRSATRQHALPVAIPAAAFACATGVGLVLELLDGVAAQGTRTAHLLAAGALVALAAGTQARPLRLRRARRAVVAATTAVSAGAGEPLARILAPIVGEPSPALRYAIPGLGWTDAAGHPVEPPDAQSATFIEDRGETIAALVQARAAPDLDLLDEALAAGRLRLDSERLQAATFARVEALRAARRAVVEASDEERRRLERDLHDGAQQRLVALRFTLGLARNRAGAGALAATLAVADAALERALAELRELSHGLYPPSLDGAGLATAIPSAAERSALGVTVGPFPAGRFAVEVERGVYRIVADALLLAERAGAHVARVEATTTGARLTVRIEHDGGDHGQLGLELLDDRVQALAGSVRCSRTPISAILVAEVPCA